MVYLVGAGPGDPGLLTVRGQQVLARADILVYDRLVAPELVELAPPEAERVYVGKAPGEHTLRQEEINALLVERARGGRDACRGGGPVRDRARRHRRRGSGRLRGHSGHPSRRRLVLGRGHRPGG